MTSKIAAAVNLRYSPVAIIFAAEKPAEALQFKEGRWGCVVSMLNAAAKGRTAVFDRKTFGCIGGGAGLGFGNTYIGMPGGIEYFLSSGNREFCESELGKNIVKNWPALSHGEAYKKTPEFAKSFADALPYYDVPTEYVIFKPLENLLPEEKPEVVVFLTTPDQLSALTVLANYARHGGDNVIIPWGAGCHSLCILPLHEGKSAKPKAVVGLIDVSARKQVDKDILSFSVPYTMYLEMEGNVEESFLTRDEWLKIRDRN
ncbi:DUF169 domain-containing protein [Sporomusa malonica]|uniref:Uncharacterized conserved protein, DUF169 family n=1 Tax=Sporomusa malonica TaxID=112901 RepID=A0A1W1YGP4_9FIRM|nr:DUF169 domain-containing protein [Sporomusa malonica]SMC35304.1 Uncharacterized conserved protein, DUF169 family [Sporomusa malonica]